jgi:hypothetical protein
MEQSDVQKLIDNCGLPDSCEQIDIKETHISWLIFTDNYVFKIKKPVKFNFLDFSTLEKREFYCKREIELNSRIENEMYHEVIEITNQMINNTISEDETVQDYAVKMSRMNNDYLMVRMLEKDDVKAADIDKLVDKISDFHRNAKPVKNVFDTSRFQSDYADIESVYKTIGDEFGDSKKDAISECVKKSFDYLNKKRSLMNERIISGFRKDIHGDLNASNIFLYETPVIFDCVEFNNEFRQIDIINEIAFLCVDLDFYGKEKLADDFYSSYCGKMEIEDNKEQKQLFRYYQSYRANIRAKVALLSSKNSVDKSEEIKHASRYLEMMERYCSEF